MSKALLGSATKRVYLSCMQLCQSESSLLQLQLLLKRPLILCSSCFKDLGKLYDLPVKILGIEMQGLKNVLKQVLLLVPPYCLIGVISFSSLVNLHQLTRDMPTAICFQGSFSASKQEVATVNASCNMSTLYCRQWHRMQYWSHLTESNIFPDCGCPEILQLNNSFDRLRHKSSSD